MSAEVRVERRGPLGLLILDAPQRLNALSPGMCEIVGDALGRWSRDEEVKAVVIKSAGGRAFCAGGDVRAVAELRREGRVEEAMRFFATEYRMNWRIFRFSKPYIAFLDGVTMGGGFGISAHGRYRVATEKVLFAMPETGIGFYPDVGATYVLPRLPGEAGAYLGLTGARIGWEDMLGLGLATHTVRSERLEALETALAQADYSEGEEEEAVERVLESFHQPPETPAPAVERRHEIDEIFAGDSVEEILKRLSAAPQDWAKEALAAMERAAPLSLRVTLQQMREGASLDFDAAMRREFRLTWRMLEGQTFLEGVRALLIDKDKSPKWEPPTLAGATPQMAAALAAPLGPGKELPLDWADPTASWPEVLG